MSGGGGEGKVEGSQAAPGNFPEGVCVHYPDCDNGFLIGVLYIKTNQIIQFKYVQFVVCPLYLNKVVFKSDLTLKVMEKNLST